MSRYGTHSSSVMNASVRVGSHHNIVGAGQRRDRNFRSGFASVPNISIGARSRQRGHRTRTEMVVTIDQHLRVGIQLHENRIGLRTVLDIGGRHRIHARGTDDDTARLSSCRPVVGGSAKSRNGCGITLTNSSVTIEGDIRQRIHRHGGCSAGHTSISIGHGHHIRLCCGG